VPVGAAVANVSAAELFHSAIRAHNAGLGQAQVEALELAE
jgi:hypothetical protein